MIVDNIYSFLENQSKKKKDFFLVSISSIISGFSYLILQTIVSNFLGLSDFGVFVQIYSIFLILVAISNFGIEVSVLKYSAEFSENDNYLQKIFSSSLLLVLFSSLLIITVVTILINYFPQIFSDSKVYLGLYYALPAVCFFAINKNISAFYSALRLNTEFSIIKIFRHMFSLLFVFIFLYLNCDFTKIFLCVSLVEFLILIFFLFRIKNKISFNLDFSWAYKHLEYGFTALSTNLGSTLSNGLIILVSGYFLSKSETGIISFIISFSSCLFLLANSIQLIINPIFVKKWINKDLNAIVEQVNTIFRITSIAFIPIILLTTSAFMLYTYLFMSAEFFNNYIIFIIFIFATNILLSYGWTSTLLNMAGYIYVNLYRGLMISIFNVFSSIIFIYYLGFYGAAYAFIINSLFSLFLSNFLIKKHLLIDFNKLILNNLSFKK